MLNKCTYHSGRDIPAPSNATPQAAFTSHAAFFPYIFFHNLVRSPGLGPCVCTSYSGSPLCNIILLVMDSDLCISRDSFQKDNHVCICIWNLQRSAVHQIIIPCLAHWHPPGHSLATMIYKLKWGENHSWEFFSQLPDASLNNQWAWGWCLIWWHWASSLLIVTKAHSTYNFRQHGLINAHRCIINSNVACWPPTDRIWIAVQTDELPPIENEKKHWNWMILFHLYPTKHMKVELQFVNPVWSSSNTC